MTEVLKLIHTEEKKSFWMQRKSETAVQKALAICGYNRSNSSVTNRYTYYVYRVTRYYDSRLDFFMERLIKEPIREASPS